MILVQHRRITFNLKKHYTEITLKNVGDSPKMQSFIHVPQFHPFPIQNLPYGVFSLDDASERHVGVAIGDYVLDLTLCERMGFLTLSDAAGYFQDGVLNTLMGKSPDVWSDVRKQIVNLLLRNSVLEKEGREIWQKVIVPQENILMYVPVNIGDYTDFYASINHASNVGKIFRDKENPLLLNWTKMPIGYHGRSSSIRESGAPLYRPKGQYQNLQTGDVIFGPSLQLDFELEMGAYIGTGNVLGEPISVLEASRYIFGFSLLNDWSARDIQRFEYQPLGPFLGKNFATFISPWVVPMEALEPFIAFYPKQMGISGYLEQELLPKIEVTLQVFLKTKFSNNSVLLSQTNTNEVYWSFEQMIAHHTINGCNLRPGDLLASGTISGSSPDAYGSLLEMTFGGQVPIAVGAEERTWLQDGDTVTFKAFAKHTEYCIGFGEVTGTILPPR